ncbi:MAG: alpha-amylase [Candidatus Lokiarchaeota archaeon]|nr:alpha-amylase [Candidatus Lokiarchaeota archaeon]
MKISRDARNKYEFAEFKFSEKGNLEFNGDIHLIRMFVQKLNQKRDLINYPEIAIRIGEFNGMALMYEINKFMFNLYKEETQNLQLNNELYDYLKKKIGSSKLEEAIYSLVEEFPPNIIYQEEEKIEKFLKDKVEGIENEIHFVDEFVNLWLGNMNSSYSPFIELFDDESLEKRTAYRDIIPEITNFFEEKAKFGPNNQNLIEMLKEPLEKYPHSIREQLVYIHDNWGSLLGKYTFQILIALDIIREEEMLRGLGPGESEVYEYDSKELENFTIDKEWMPKVVMIAKNVYVWMDQLSKKYSRTITKLHDIPNEELNQLKEWGFTGLWLIGLWERSQASKTIKRWCGNPEAEASAYSTYEYVISHDLGGYDSYNNLKSRALERGIRLGCDVVPNHTGIVSKWVLEHPDWYISLPYSPFPSYSFSGENLSGDPNIGIYLEDKYFSRTDAAVTFKYENFRTGEIKYVYHGNDGTSFPWNDTAQLDFLNPDVRETVIQTILEISKMFPIIRFDAAMTLTRKHYQRLWFPEPGTGGAIPSRAEHGISKDEFYKAMPSEFWREVVDRINEENPDTLLLAEAFWLLEGFFVRTLGMHRVYNSAFMNMLRDEDNAMYRSVLKNTLQFDPEILKRFVNFLNNPDEETAIKQFGDGDKYFGVCLMMITMPGLPMFGHGQIEGYHEKYGMEYRRAYWDEDINIDLLKHHQKIIFPIMRKRYLYADVTNFLLYDFWTGTVVNEDVFAYSNRVNNECVLIIYHNKYTEVQGFIKNSVGFALKVNDNKEIVQRTLAEGLKLPIEGYCIFKDYLTGLEYIRRTKELNENGLYLELHAYQMFLFIDFQIINDNEFFHYAQLHDLLNGKGVPNIDETLHELVHQPLHESFKKVFNSNSLKDFLNFEKARKEAELIYINLDAFLLEVKKYSTSQKDYTDIKKDIVLKIEVVLKLKHKLKELKIPDEYKGIFINLLPISEVEWSILLSYLIVHQMGRFESSHNYKLLSRSLFDEWRLFKYINSTLNEMSKDKKEKKLEMHSILKLMIGLQGWSNSVIKGETDLYSVFQLFFSDPDVQQFLKVNRYQQLLWYNAELFDNFIKWMWLIAIIEILIKPMGEANEDLKKLLDYYVIIKKVSKITNFQVVKFLDDLHNYPQT